MRKSRSIFCGMNRAIRAAGVEWDGEPQMTRPALERRPSVGSAPPVRRVSSLIRECGGHGRVPGPNRPRSASDAFRSQCRQTPPTGVRASPPRTTALALRDLTVDVPVVRNRPAGLSLAIQVDPTIDPTAVDSIRRAAELFVRVATDPELIREAFDTSVDRPEPMPAEFVMKDGKPVIDDYGHQVYTDDFRYFLSDRYRPRDPEAFATHVKSALSTPSGDPALLVVSRVTGDNWWGNGRIGYAVLKDFQLMRESPPQGYLYIGLRSDLLTTTNTN
jgi:hypothetical protein